MRLSYTKMMMMMLMMLMMLMMMMAVMMMVITIVTSNDWRGMHTPNDTFGLWAESDFSAFSGSALVDYC